jgi:hypothetical protein
LPKQEEPKIYVDGRHIPYHIECWRANHTIIDHALAYIDDSSIAHAAFDLYMQRRPKDELTLRRGALLMRDSRRPDVREA